MLRQRTLVELVILESVHDLNKDHRIYAQRCALDQRYLPVPKLEIADLSKSDTRFVANNVLASRHNHEMPRDPTQNREFFQS